MLRCLCAFLQYLHIRVAHVNKERELNAVGKLDALMEAMYDVYDFDPLIIINMFHLQSSETLKNLSNELLNEIKELSRRSIGAIAAIFKEGIEQGVFVNHHPTAIGRYFLVAFFRRCFMGSEQKNH